MTNCIDRGRSIIAVVALVLTTGLTACGAGTDSSTAPPAPAGEGRVTYPVAITSCDLPLSFPAAPSRVVSLAQPQTDLLVALGLADRVVGQAQVLAPNSLPGSGTTSTSEIPVLSDDGVPSKEITLSAEPDLVLAPTPFEFRAAQGFASVDDIVKAGANAYQATAGCTGHGKNRAVTDTLTDIENLGRIFDVEQRAGDLADRYRSTLDEVAEKVADATPVRVAELYVYGESIEALSASSKTDTVKAAGGQNIFDGTEEMFKDVHYAKVSAEIIAAEQPDAIILPVSSPAEADAAVAFLTKTFPNVPAVRDNRIIPYSSAASLPGSLHLPEAIRAIAQRLHPNRF
ncbi:ABC transporter substrate-binding protein [Micromonospora craniellae]|uniref:Zinc ABC transporter substrate-binding protein n=1 Tax=Micromonospora craniellae TaxID=2294034 RepID=A0A372FYS9_9ACTN|nr:ABC transporter substrate-binding protein [Micromonospora craniellae]QOC93436.1 ABC transporter substrate-binding protein [Micromonospora craniellae]RFS45883.1 zinc ABC transporter substrate-binding protein [Micromonospora craniellae]